MTCPKCHAERTSVVKTLNDAIVVRHHRCPACGTRWKSDQRLRKGSVVVGSLVAIEPPPLATNSHEYISSPGSLISLPDPDPKSNLSRKSRARVERFSHQFEVFWELYPRKKAKKAALKAWCDKQLDQVADAVIAGIELQRAEFLVTMAEDPRKVPHPATWLNGERWKDEADRMPVHRGRPARSEGNIEMLSDWLQRGAK